MFSPETTWDPEREYGSRAVPRRGFARNAGTAQHSTHGICAHLRRFVRLTQRHAREPGVGIVGDGRRETTITLIRYFDSHPWGLDRTGFDVFVWPTQSGTPGSDPNTEGATLI